MKRVSDFLLEHPWFVYLIIILIMIAYCSGGAVVYFENHNQLSACNIDYVLLVIGSIALGYFLAKLELMVRLEEGKR
jgi:carbon starvation protein CstA